jgi:uncharacterized membrane protein YebE (DUF533 family)
VATNTTTDENTTMTGLVRGIIDDAQELIKQQFALFKAEVREDSRKTTEATTTLGMGALLAFVGVLVLSFALAHLLAWATETHLWVWYLVVGGVTAAIGGALAYAGYEKFRSFNPLPDKTAKALSENLTWPKNPA